jgi:signal transduction histidine kinase/ligand-binding sensor domain-containing protein
MPPTPKSGEGVSVSRLPGWCAKLLILCLLLGGTWRLGWPAPAPEAPPQTAPQISQYAHASWTARDGAQLGLVFAFAQTHDGYLWVGGSYGLFRFDGLRFVPWQPPKGPALPSNPYSLLVSRDGTLWIGTFNGLVSWNGSQLTRYPETDGWLITSLMEDSEGTVWAGLFSTPGQLCAIRDGRARCEDAQGGFGLFVWSLAQDRSGTLWAGAESGLWQWRPGTPRRIDTPGARLGDLSLTPDGELLAGIRGAGLWRPAGDRLVPYPLRSATGAGALLSDHDIKSNKLLRDRDGGLWIGTEGQGLLHVRDGRTDAFTRADGLSGNIACSLFEDREGNIWFGSDKGVDRFRKLPVTSLSKAQGLPHEATRSVLATRDGSVWVATDDGLARWKDGGVAVYKEAQGLPDVRVQSLYEDHEGVLWASTARGLAYLAPPPASRASSPPSARPPADRFSRVDGVPAKEIYSMTGDDAGNLWLSGNEGLIRLRQGRFVETLPWSAFGRRQQAKVIAADRGGLWMAFWQDGGVMRVKDGKILAAYGVADGLGSGHVAGLRVDADGTVWAATEEGGLSRIKDGRVSTLTTGEGLPCNTIHWSIVDDDGAMWLYTACGLIRIQRDDLAAWETDPRHRVTPKAWGGSDGVPLLALTAAYFNPPVAKARDGRLWLASGTDIQLLDPAHLPFNPLPPPVHIESLVADHKSYAVAPGLRLPPQVRDLTIEFAALSLVDPKNTRFRYRLDGHDTDWQAVVDRRQASYTNLPPGAYRFRVKAANNSGIWNEDGAQLAFSIEPAFHQTAWFRLLALALLLALAWSAFQLWMRLRIRRERRQFEATLEARVAERTRIARDLHDTLLQRFNGVLLQFQAACNLLPDRPRESRQVLSVAIDQVAEAITEGRDTVQGLRSAASAANDLAQALREFAATLARECGRAASAHVEVQGAPRMLDPGVRDEAFFIAGEALRNAFHHAGAAQVDVEIRHDPRQLRVRVRDDGQGIDPAILQAGKEGHFGLSGMRERAELLGGRLTVRSGAGAGTEVELSVPAARAYSPFPQARSWFPFKSPATREIVQ